jgi:uncharacterized membrane protein
MSQLFAVVYDTPEAARREAERVRDLARGQTLTLRDMVIVTRNAGGEVALDQSVNLVAAGALGGAFWGSLIGLVFLVPLAGAVGGAAAGAIGGWLTDYGIDDKFMRRTAQDLTPGKAALFVLVDDMNADKVAPVIGAEPGKLLYSSLNASVDELFSTALSRAVDHPAPTAAI